MYRLTISTSKDQASIVNFVHFSDEEVRAYYFDSRWTLYKVNDFYAVTNKRVTWLLHFLNEDLAKLEELHLLILNLPTDKFTIEDAISCIKLMNTI